MLLSPVVGCQCRPCGPLGEARIVLISFIYTCSLRHDSRKVVAGGHALLHHVALLVALNGHHHSLEVRRGQLVIDTAVVGILHGNHPFQVIHQLVQEVSRLVTLLRDVHLQGIEVSLVLLVGVEHQSHRVGRVDDILVEVARIVPSVRRRDDGACWTSWRDSRRVNHDLRVGMSQRTGPLSGILRLDGHTRAVQVERLDASSRQVRQCMFLDFYWHLVVLALQHVAARSRNLAEVHDGTTFLRPRRLARTQEACLADHLARFGITHGQRDLLATVIHYGYLLLLRKESHLIHSDHVVALGRRT